MRLRLRGLKIEVRRVASLTPAERAEVWDFASRFTDSTRSGFDASFETKRDAILIRKARRGPLVGLGGVSVQLLEADDGSKRVVIFPGDTLFDPAVRGKSLVEQLGFLYFLEARVRYPTRPIYMLYGTFSYKSYLMLPRNFAIFWPRRDRPTPSLERAFIDKAARCFYQNIRPNLDGNILATATKRLHSGVATVTPELLKNEDIRFFYEQNPGYDQGDVLLCLTPLSTANWWHLAGLMRRRMMPARPVS